MASERRETRWVNGLPSGAYPPGMIGVVKPAVGTRSAIPRAPPVINGEYQPA